jgi:tRNA(adenine34) deaminase
MFAEHIVYSKVAVPLMDEFYMREALKLARIAANGDEVPVGAIVVAGGEIIGRGSNSPVTAGDPTAHAEMIAIREAARNTGNYRLAGADLYCTLEPCAMCAGALVNARIRRLIFGARELKSGAVRSKFRIADSDLLNHRVEIVEGVLGVECVELLQSFFNSRR